MKQEGGHIDFYASEAERRLAETRGRSSAHPFCPKASLAPRGFGGHAQGGGRVLGRYLFDDDDGEAVAERIDRQIDRLPGQSDLHLLGTAVHKLSRLEIAA